MKRMRDLQEKAADRQADIDQLRARRAYEEQERNARRKEREEFEKKQRLIADLEVARVEQFATREAVLA